MGQGLSLPIATRRTTGPFSTKRMDQRETTESVAFQVQLLTKGQRALQVIRCQVSGILLVTGVVLGVVHQYDFFYNEWQELSWINGIWWLPGVFSMITIGLVPLPNDRVVTYMSLAANCMPLTLEAVLLYVSFLTSIKDSEEQSCIYRSAKITHKVCEYREWANLGEVSIACMIVAVSVALMMCMWFLQLDAMLSQRLMWLNIAMYFVLFIVLELISLVVEWFGFGFFSGYVWYMPGDVLGLFWACSPSCRRHVHAWLIRCINRRGAVAAAAGVASLVGDCEPREAVAIAKARFRSFSLANLSADDFRSLHEDADVFHWTCTVALTRLGHCDAFLSHSWHDSSDVKWQALQRWRTNFVLQHGREPYVWFDKLCIDQTMIEDDLRALPIFLSGCKEFVILCGKTYLSRLWCVIELFAFLHMHGDAGKVTVLPLVHEDCEDVDREAIRETWREFDVRDCRCFVPSDKEKMQGMICASFGGMENFNVAIKNMLFKADGLSWFDEEPQPHIGGIPMCSFGSLSQFSHDSDTDD